MAGHPERIPRWDVLDEHLAEGGFRWSRWNQSLDAPDYTLDEVVELEEMAIAHVDALVLGGQPVAKRLLVPALVDEEPERVVVAALALLDAERPSGTAAVLDALPQAEPPALAALQRAFELSPTAVLPAGLTALLTQEDGAPELFALALDSVGAHGLATSAVCTPFLSHPEPRVAAAALRAASQSRLPLEPARLQRALDSSEPALRDAAILAGLMSGAYGAWSACRALAGTPGGRLPLLLLGMSGDAHDTKRLLELLPDEKLQPDVLWALGFCGRVTAADACLELMRKTPVAALAGEAFSAITGLSISERFAAPPEDEADPLPPLEDEDLDADLSSRPEGALPKPHVEAISAWWKEARQRMGTQQRFLAGQPFTPRVLLEAIASAPMRRRHALALELALRSRGAIQVQTRTFTAKQVASWKEACAASVAAFSRPFSEGLRG
ncbi:hypothetical protein A176_001621 [Myxococcus hansupus]|uniref:TIGR02270 family protein n=1 Tax=Pseudomyxococcus hansupus TaxID=1297742 RepID=A0A0H4WPL7_9BACT|nr:TIGR02270 family protein [Myxococcus hansupus]AKQ64709.1 hypothetical protein A176_001621 [Myxococcus hansupus]